MRSRTRRSHVIRLLVFCVIVTATAGVAVSPAGALPESAAATEWVGAGRFNHVYNTARLSPPRYLNDHTLIKGRDGLWHMFGITGTEAPQGVAPDSRQEDNLAHATAPSLNGPWTTQPYALTVNPTYHGEDHLWAPHVIENAGTYYMFYAAGLGRDAAINLATSQDLFTWTRHPGGPLFRDGLEARDPFVTRVGSQWVMYYTATSTPDGGNHVVAYRTSTDLITWSGRQIAYTDPTTTADSGPVTESPFVVERDGWWYLFIGPRGGYVGTDVYRSQNPLRFAIGDYAGHVPAHAPEIVQDGAQWWVSHAGWFQDGLHIAPLRWRSTPPPFHTPANPAVARNADGRLEVFAISADGASIIHRWQTAPSGGWSAWATFGTAAGAVPSIGQNADGRLEVYALGVDGANLMRRVQTSPSGGWGPWETFGGPAGAVPAVGRNADGRLEVFALAPAGASIAHRWQLAANSNQWSEWETFGGPAGGPPVVGQNADGRLEVFALGPGGGYIAHRRQSRPSGGWDNWATFGGPAGGSPVVGQNADGRLEVFALSTYGSAISHRWQTAPSGGWSGWEHFGSWAGGTPTVVRNADGRLEVFAIGPGNDYLAHRWQTAPSGGWGPWEIFGGPAQCVPSGARQSDGRLVMFALHPGGDGISTRTQTAPSQGWSGWQVFSTGAVGGTACASAS
ncbi:family 43 glycosylhydrolase [Nonomuraea sp. NPDC046802]|uniref:family 43 glycosylhydrolase n=1 Tax=Nonomuraea sp. NPDC046802 TaxID=3154919 RepID=UPI0034119A9B